MISLLILLPILCIVLSLYVVMLINFVLTNDLDMMLTFLSAFLNVVISFFVIKTFISANGNIAFIRNLDRKSDIIHGYFSFILLFILGVSLVINSIVHKINMYNLIIGLFIIISFIIITYVHLIKTIKEALELTDIDDTEDELNCLIFLKNGEELEYYVNKKEKYKINSKYLCKISSSNGSIKKIIKEER